MAALMFGTKYAEKKKHRNAIENGEPYSGQDLGTTRASSYAPPSGYTLVAEVGQTMVYENPTDLAYGANGKFNYKKGFTGTITFGDDVFGDPLPGVVKAGYAKTADAVASSSSKGLVIAGLIALAGIAAFIIYKKKHK
jgi:LPXTG-motif cell wall-anchored protein